MIEEKTKSLNKKLDDVNDKGKNDVNVKACEAKKRCQSSNTNLSTYLLHSL